MRVVLGLVAVGLLTAGCGSGSRGEATPSAAAPTTAASPTVDPADAVACAAFVKALKPSRELFDKSDSGESFPPLAVSITANDSAKDARFAATAASRALAAEIERTAGKLDRLMSKADVANTGTAAWSFKAEADAVLSTAAEALKHCAAS
jgi:hypothetical protein